MNRLLYTLVGLFALATLSEKALSQENDIATFNTLRTPASPAFTILGVAPTSIERPNTPQDFAVSFLNKTQNLSTLPSDYALEFAPFWMFSHPTLTWEKDKSRDILESMARTWTISLASAEIGTDALPVTGFALGFRTSLWSGTSTNRAVNAFDTAAKTLAQASSMINNATDTLDKQLSEAIKNNPTKTEELTALFTSKKAKIVQSIQASASYKAAVALAEEELSGLIPQIQERNGFSLDFAGALAWKVPGKIIDSMSLNQWGIWLTPSYVLDECSFVAVARFLQDNENSKNQNIDLGARFIYTIDKFAISAEAVLRSQKMGGQTESLTRVAGVLEYQIMPNTWLQGTFGKDYQPSAQGSLLAQLGLSFNFSGKRFQLPTPSN